MNKNMKTFLNFMIIILSLFSCDNNDENTQIEFILGYLNLPPCSLENKIHKYYDYIAGDPNGLNGLTEAYETTRKECIYSEERLVSVKIYDYATGYLENLNEPYMNRKYDFIYSDETQLISVKVYDYIIGNPKEYNGLDAYLVEEYSFE